jgi:predicted Holliday junction resolvase-like endonuclease
MDQMTLIGVLLVSNFIFIYLFLSRLGKDKQIREDAIRKSRLVLEGKFKEQLAPLMPEFRYNPTDARFLGSPVDFVVFNGLANNEPKEIVFIEVKTGNAQPTERENLVKEAIDKKKVRYELIRI